MAYGEKYSTILAPLSPLEDGSCILTIFEKDYIGAVDNTLPFDVDSVILTRNFEDFNSHISGNTLQFGIRNNKQNYFTLRELMFAKEKKYLVKLAHIKNLEITKLFEGYINTEVVSQKYLRYQTINLVASSHISKLAYKQPASIEDLENKIFINIILECLAALDDTTPVWVNCSGIIVNEDFGFVQYGTAHTILNRTGIYSEVFWKNDVERMNSYEIIETILKSLKLYMYWWDGKWIIEHFSNLRKTTSKSFVVYEQGQTYTVTNGTSSDPGTITFFKDGAAEKDVHSLVFMGMSQTVFAEPGVQQVVVKLNEFQKFLNFVSNYYITATDTTTPIPEAPLRKWLYYSGYSEFMWDKGLWGSGHSFNTIKNCIIKGVTDPTLYTGGDNCNRGLTTKFQYLVKEGSKIMIRFKYGFDKGVFKTYVATPSSGIVEVPFTKYSDYAWTFRWYLFADDFPGISNRMYGISYDAETDTWSATMLDSSTPTQAHENAFIQRTLIEGSTFDNVNNVVEISITIPIGDLVYPIYGVDKLWEFRLGIATETIFYKPAENQSYSSNLKTPAQMSYYGDVIVESDESNIDEPNLFEGSINEDYLGKEPIDIDIADIASINYKNGVLRGDKLEYRTSLWYHTAEGAAYSLIEWLFFYRFRQKNLPRIKIVGNAKHREIIVPFSPFYDSADPDVPNRPFIVTGYRYFPVSQTYEALTLMEYDSTTEVNLTVEEE